MENNRRKTREEEKNQIAVFGSLKSGIKESPAGNSIGVATNLWLMFTYFTYTSMIYISLLVHTILDIYHG